MIGFERVALLFISRLTGTRNLTLIFLIIIHEEKVGRGFARFEIKNIPKEVVDLNHSSETEYGK